MSRGRLNQMVALVMFLVGVASLQGCALGTRNIALRYEPTFSGERAGNGTIAITKFDDLRPDRKILVMEFVLVPTRQSIREKNIVGEVRNAYGMRTATVRAKGQDLGAWVANALAEELNRAGLHVQKYSDAAPPNLPFVIRGAVLEAYVRMYMFYRTRIRVQVTVERDGLPVLNKEYTGKAGGLAVLVSAGSYERQLEQALQSIMMQVVPDVLSCLRK